MFNVIKTVHLPVRAEKLWRDIGSFGAVGAWHPMLSGVDSQGDVPGARRIAHSRDGGIQVERLKDYNGTDCIYRYEMESTPMRLRDYIGEFRVDDNGDGTSTVTWMAHFEPADGNGEETARKIETFIKAGTDSLKARYINQ
ncbi:MAG TPA: SRPBCC family protein [Steroidobacteraceae bacterium]|nr:SRPBCC family protein [Steroidobacteraceae bacterium]